MAEVKKAYLGTGRRKTSVARVRLTDGTGTITINGRPFDQYFTEVKDRNAVTGPLALVENARIDTRVTVHGGGITGQAGAISQGIARAIKRMFNLNMTPVAPAAPVAVTVGEDGQPAPAAEPTSEGSLTQRLRDSGYLTRDSRMKERKKYGRKGARKSFQFSKR